MAVPVTETVNFNVNVQCFEREGKWIAVTIETGIIAVGETEQEAMEAAERWNIFSVSEAKKNGRLALGKYLESRGIRYELNSQYAPDGLAEVAALRNVPLAATLSKRGHVALAA